VGDFQALPVHCSVIVNDCNVHGIRVNPAKNQPPVAAQPDAVIPLHVTAQRMKMRAGKIHVLREFRNIQTLEKARQPLMVDLADSPGRSRPPELSCLNVLITGAK